MTAVLLQLHDKDNFHGKFAVLSFTSYAETLLSFCRSASRSTAAYQNTVAVKPLEFPIIKRVDNVYSCVQLSTCIAAWRQ
jgi:hypothetical protein